MLKALMEYIGGSNPNKPLEQLNGFSLIKSDIETSQKDLKSFYLCLGRHDFFLVPRPVTSNSHPVNGSSFPALFSFPLTDALLHSDFSAPQPAQTAVPQPKKILVVSYTAVDSLLRLAKDDQFQIVLKK